jgi:hypothetical protein
VWFLIERNFVRVFEKERKGKHRKKENLKAKERICILERDEAGF